MKMRLPIVILATGVFASAGVLAEGSHQILTGGGDVKWTDAPPNMPKGAQIAVLSGDPSKEGPFTLRIKTPANYDIPAHNHPTEEAVTVISGEFYVGMGDKLDKAHTQKLGPGGFVVAPARMNHFAYTPVETVVQVTGSGPFAITYANPQDDPSAK
jgi:quercetin dioxygenase-like cupin family protein